MTGMIERCCRVMCADAGFNPDEVMPNDGPRWVYYKPLFISAIKAVREPTDGMIAAASDTEEVSLRASYPDSDASFIIGGEVIIWQAMIDAALGAEDEQ